MLPNAFGEGAGVQAVQRRHIVLLEPVSEALEAVPVGVIRRVGGHDQALDVDRRALSNNIWGLGVCQGIGSARASQ